MATLQTVLITGAGTGVDRSATVEGAADTLAERSRTAKGLAEKIYRRLAEILQGEAD